MPGMIENGEATFGSGNVFADLELPDAGWLKIKSGLTIEIAKAIREQGLTHTEATQRTGLSPQKLSALLRGGFSKFSQHRLMDCLTRLGYDIEIRVCTTPMPAGHLTLTRA